MFIQGRGGACKTKGKYVRHCCRGRMRCTRASTGRCFLIGGEGTSLRQLRGRSTDERLLVRCLEASWALKEEREGKDGGSLAVAGLAFGGAQGTLRAARRLLYLP